MDNANSYRSMVMDALGPESNWHSGGFNERSFEYEQSNGKTANFYDLLNDADEPLWESCKKHTKLSVVSQLLNSNRSLIRARVTMIVFLL